MDWRAEKSIIITIHNDIDENEKRRGYIERQKTWKWQSKLISLIGYFSFYQRVVWYVKVVIEGHVRLEI